MDEESQPTPVELSAGLSRIRRRRWYLWGMLIVYLPLIKVAMVLGQSTRTTVIVVALWVLCAFGLTFFAALARCPRCGNYFHMHGMSLLFLRKCLHCQLHLCADRR